MPVHQLNHAVLYVRDAQRSAAFYHDVMGFRKVEELAPGPEAVFLKAPGSTNDHDLGVFTVGPGAASSNAADHDPTVGSPQRDRPFRCGDTRWRRDLPQLTVEGGSGTALIKV